MKIELLHPVTHGEDKVVQTYSRGVHDLPEALAKHFLTHKDHATGEPIARLPQVRSEAPAGKVELAEEKGKKK